MVSALPSAVVCGSIAEEVVGRRYIDGSSCWYWGDLKPQTSTSNPKGRVSRDTVTSLVGL